MIILAANEKEISKYVNYSGKKLFEYLEHAVKPTTVIYQYTGGLAENLIATDHTIAIRICKESFCHELIKEFGKPIVSTSANISGEMTPENFSAVSERIRKGVDYIVKYRQEDRSAAVPSAVIRWENEKPVIIRP